MKNIKISNKSIIYLVQDGSRKIIKRSRSLIEYADRVYTCTYTYIILLKRRQQNTKISLCGKKDDWSIKNRHNYLTIRYEHFFKEEKNCQQSPVSHITRIASYEIGAADAILVVV